MRVFSYENRLKRSDRMAKTLRPLIAANWKMHGDLSWVFKPADFNLLYPVSDREHLDVLICPPATLVAPMLDTDQTGVLIGGQDCHANAKGWVREAGQRPRTISAQKCKWGSDWRGRARNG